MHYEDGLEFQPDDHRAKPQCMAPFSQLLLSPTGQVHPCCYHFGYQLGVDSKNLDAIWNGNKLRKLRREFLQGNPKICKSRMKNLNCHRDFERFRGEPVSEIMDLSLRRLDLRLSGQCNLKCVMCDVWQQPRDQHEQSFLWDDTQAGFFENLREIEFAGGEPFIQKDVFKLIDRTQAMNPEVIYSFITNGNYLHSKKIEKLFHQIRVRRIQFSLDAINEDSYRLIRIGGDFAMLQDNLRRMIAIRDQKVQPNLEIKASFCIVKHNWEQIPAFIEFCKQKDLVCELQYAHYDAGSQLSLNSYPADKLALILETIYRELRSDQDRILATPITTAIEQTINRKMRQLSVSDV